MATNLNKTVLSKNNNGNGGIVSLRLSMADVAHLGLTPNDRVVTMFKSTVGDKTFLNIVKGATNTHRSITAQNYVVDAGSAWRVVRSASELGLMMPGKVRNREMKTSYTRNHGSPPVVCMEWPDFNERLGLNLVSDRLQDGQETISDITLRDARDAAAHVNMFAADTGLTPAVDDNGKFIWRYEREVVSVKEFEIRS